MAGVSEGDGFRDQAQPLAGLFTDEAGFVRCDWCAGDAQYVKYHDLEWGFPVADSVRLFEKICLEGFQAGLSWLTILRKRENFRRAFCGFDFHAIARFDDRDIERLLSDAGIVRHRGKIEATIHNARRAIELVEECGSLANFFWRFEPMPKRRSGECPAQTPESKALSVALKDRGWRFVGPTTAYAFMQAMGLVNDHLPTCHIFAQVERSRSEFQVPGDATR